MSDSTIFRVGLVLASLGILLIPRSGFAYDFNCEPWGTGEMRCMARISSQENFAAGTVNMKISLISRNAVTFNYAMYTSSCGLSGTSQESGTESLSAKRAKSFEHSFSTAGQVLNALQGVCMEVFATNCKSGSGGDVPCFGQFSGEASTN